ncbi:hypothetical protein GCM10007860_14900 [Chitiniphilus shinanonensis]|uniref:Lipoprotein n=1 Tax=Chitiniphilus shinanonensis TaxID=553088 RepID=A0ABQ6BQT0_9NEIS|nr:hypothetical protein [Chitiniphilus shinanonensis]GLS04343.1 hypothetical protein GCM10007860_14900 [Chitiniphilus shinanonensis]
MSNSSVKLISASVLATMLAACGGDGDGNTKPTPTPAPSPTPTPAPGEPVSRTLTGTVRAANGDPIPYAAVYVAGNGSGKLVSVRPPSRAEVDPSAACQASIPANVLAGTCSGPDGSFSLTLPPSSTPPSQLVIQKGSLKTTKSIACGQEATCALPSSATTVGAGDNNAYPAVAVVTGNYDQIENVLAKLGDADLTDEVAGVYGRVDSAGRFVYGSEYGSKLTIIDGGGMPLISENAAQIGSYPTWASFLDGTRPLLDANGKPLFSVIFIDCGNDADGLLSDPAVRARLKAYVDAGGRLYVTDWSYNFVEQVFPQAAKFEGDPDDASTPGSPDAAKSGSGGLHLNAAINLPALATWLKAVPVVSNVAGSAPGNPESDCASTGTVNGALNSDGTLPVGDFLGAWVHIAGFHDAAGSLVVSSGSGVDFDGLVNRPLTFIRAEGNQGGKLIYSSYHTADECPSTRFWPQERVLQFLIFESI